MTMARSKSVAIVEMQGLMGIMNPRDDLTYAEAAAITGILQHALNRKRGIGLRHDNVVALRKSGTA